VICFRNSKPARGVGVAATAFPEKHWVIVRKKKIDTPITVFGNLLNVVPLNNFMSPPKKLKSR
jgi:hypothetical protein